MQCNENGLEKYFNLNLKSRPDVSTSTWKDRPFLPDPGIVPRTSTIRLGLCFLWSLKHFSSAALSVPQPHRPGSPLRGQPAALGPRGEPEADTCPLMFLPDTPFPYTAAFFLGLLMNGGGQRLARVSAPPPASSWALERKCALRPQHQKRQVRACRVWTLLTQNILALQHIGRWVRVRQRALSIEMIFSSQKKHLPQKALV